MKRRIMTISLLAPLALVSCTFTLAHLNATARALQQRARQQQRGRTPMRRTRPVMSGAIDYSSFSHRSRSHQQACSNCHKAPTPDWRIARAFPDITDYPGHESCVSCHRQQFFNGARPVICSVCHTRTSPRDDARFAFGQPNLSPRPQRASEQREFRIEFPHDRHQDVIAKLGPAHPSRAAEESFTQASFRPGNGAPADEQARFNNCTICHETNRALPKAPHGGWPGAYAPPPETFKTRPASHASCFNCHWQNQAPVSTDCAGCHKPSAPFTPADWPRRISAKFIHEGGGTDPDITKRAHIAECTTCHINITRASTLRGLKPDVPIAVCATCHTNDMLVTYRNMKTIEMELDQFEKSRNCAYCHTPDVGREAAPQSHCLAVGRPVAQCRNER